MERVLQLREAAGADLRRWYQHVERFKALTPGCPKYLALHSVACPDVLLSAEYRLKGGGNFAKWQSHITDWHRNVYEGIELMLAVGPTDLLALTFDGSSAFEHDDEAFRLEAVALDMKPAFRWLRVFDLVKVDLARLRLEGLALYEPMGKRLMPGVRNE
ncbi:sugar ABC transporter [Rhizobium jaguaris]|uniref:sugar ABC transporter n=1 Tax=Rhizobium jaguaris TaxID=1312183 RepID=UPI001968E4C8|nr:sugar ABC transporter [Rhizobium jaguaris]